MAYLTTKNSYLNVCGHQIAYRKVGQVKQTVPLVMLGHLAATLDEWDPKLIDLLSKERHLILLDLPGVGASQGKVAQTIQEMAKQALAIIQSLGYESFDLLGLSMGGMIAQELVYLKPEAVKHLILVGTGPRGGIGIAQVPQVTFKFMLKAALTQTDPKRWIFYEHDTLGQKVATKVLGRLSQRRPEYVDHPIKVSSFLRQLRAIRHYGKQPPSTLDYLACPTLIVNGTHDQMVATKNSEILYKKIKNSRLRLYASAGHGSLFQYPREFATEVSTFLHK